jgi:SAM-dependent methyltransferase
MMFGRRDEFDYHACDGCGALQIADCPANLADYYPPDYYSMASALPPGSSSALIRWLMRRRATRELGALDPIGALLVRLRGRRECYDWFRFARLSQHSAILDVGCGNGALLRRLRDDGFTRLEGVDPFTTDAYRHQEGFEIRRELTDAEGPVDFVLMDDSLEHMPDQVGVLSAVRRVCGPHGHVCISVPVVGEAWRRYGTDWVQLDPPRHLYLHTERSVDRLARQTGFVVQSARFDSTAFQFWGSEQYRRDVPLNDRRSLAHDPADPLFSAEEVRVWEAQARALNRARSGDHATFFLRPT